MRQHTAFPARKIAMSYTQLTQDERYHIQYLSRYCTIAEIAKQLNRHKSTISREIKRHCIQGQQYSAEKAQKQSRLTKQHRRKPYKPDSQLVQHIDTLIRRKLSPNRYVPTCANTTGSHSITAPFTATSAKTKATAALCGNISEYAANPTANATAAHGPEAKCPTASA